MTNEQCDSCGAVFDIDEEGLSDVMPDGTTFSMCASCQEDAARTVAWFYS